MSGGFIGLVAFPTDGDINKAKLEVSAKMKDELRTNVLNELPDGFAVLSINDDESGSIKYKIIDEVDAKNRFKVEATANLVAIAYKEEDLKNMLLANMKQEMGEGYSFRTLEVDMGSPIISSGNNLVELAITIKSDTNSDLDIDELKNLLAGKRPV